MLSAAERRRRCRGLKAAGQICFPSLNAYFTEGRNDMAQQGKSNVVETVVQPQAGIVHRRGRVPSRQHMNLDPMPRQIFREA
jgi:hypothetical protein